MKNMFENFNGSERFDIQYNDDTGKHFGVFLYDYPEISQAKHNYITYSVPGRNGELIGTTDYLSNITIRCTFSVLHRKLMSKMRDLKRWLSGTGQLKFSDTADGFYEVLKVNHESLERELRKYGRFTVAFTCYPYEFACNGQFMRDTIKHNGYDRCMPLYEITGDGECVLTVNGKSVKALISKNLTIDTRLGIAYQKGNVLMNTSITGNYENLWIPHGDCSVAISDGFDLKIMPRWGYDA